MIEAILQRVVSGFQLSFLFIVVVGILVFVHEAGHFLTAKMFRMQVEVFSLGFGKRLFGRKKGETDYRVSIIPLGGYVKLAGGDEGTDAQGPFPPNYFVSRPRWQRFLVMSMGPAVNIAMAVALFAAAYCLGLEEPVPLPAIVDEVTSGSPAADAGVLAGDRIVKADAMVVDEVDDLREALIRTGSRPLHLVLARGSDTIHAEVTPRFNVDGVPELGIGFSAPAVAWAVVPGTPAEAAGLVPRDRILTINGAPVADSSEAQAMIMKHPGEEIVLSIERGSETLEIALTPAPTQVEGHDEKVGIIGINLHPVEMVKLPLGPAIVRGFSNVKKQAGALFYVIGNLVTWNQPISTLSGPIGIARMTRTFLDLGYGHLAWLMAFISLQLGILNLLPVPLLDGGHIFILLTEGVLRRDLSFQLKEKLNQVGFALLVTLMGVVVMMDIYRSI